MVILYVSTDDGTLYPEKDIDLLMDSFHTLDKIFDVQRDVLIGLYNDPIFVQYLLKVLDNLRSKVISGRKI